MEFRTGPSSLDAALRRGLGTDSEGLRMKDCVQHRIRNGFWLLAVNLIFHEDSLGTKTVRSILYDDLDKTTSAWFERNTKRMWGLWAATWLGKSRGFNKNTISWETTISFVIPNAPTYSYHSYKYIHVYYMLYARVKHSTKPQWLILGVNPPIRSPPSQCTDPKIKCNAKKYPKKNISKK